MLAETASTETFGHKCAASTMTTCMDRTITTSDQTISSNLERVDSTGFNYIGSGMSQSSGIFTFPSTGIYKIYLQFLFQSSGTAPYHGLHIMTTTDNSSYSAATENYVGLANNYNSASSQFIFDVTNTSTHSPLLFLLQ